MIDGELLVSESMCGRQHELLLGPVCIHRVELVLESSLVGFQAPVFLFKDKDGGGRLHVAQAGPPPHVTQCTCDLLLVGAAHVKQKQWLLDVTAAL